MSKNNKTDEILSGHLKEFTDKIYSKRFISEKTFQGIKAIYYQGFSVYNLVLRITDQLLVIRNNKKEWNR